MVVKINGFFPPFTLVSFLFDAWLTGWGRGEKVSNSLPNSVFRGANGVRMGFFLSFEDIMICGRSLSWAVVMGYHSLVSVVCVAEPGAG